MVDQLRKSVEDLEEPLCPNCRITMKWYRSVRLVAKSGSSIEHFFQCATCGRRDSVKTMDEEEDGGIPPARLSRPAAAAGAATTQAF